MRWIVLLMIFGTVGCRCFHEKREPKWGSELELRTKLHPHHTEVVEQVEVVVKVKREW